MSSWQSRVDGETDEGHQFANDAERLVWDRLSRQVHQDTVLVPNLRLTSTQKDHELDILVLMPEVGIVVVEVKGGSVSVDGQGRWWSGGRNPDRAAIRPVEQARDGKYALRAFIEADPRWKNCRSRVRFGHAIVLPYTDLASDFATPDCPRWMVSGRATSTTSPAASTTSPPSRRTSNACRRTTTST